MNRIAPGGVCLALAVAGPAFAQASFKHSAEVHRAYETLRQASCFEETHVGFAGSLSRYVEAFRVILIQEKSEASETFRELSKDKRTTTAGKLYALSGLYFTDPALFPGQLEQLSKLNGSESVCTMSGCIQGSARVDEILRSPRKRMQIARGQSIKEYFDAETKAGRHEGFDGDIAGGYTPLSFLEGDPKANLDPL